jgi:hypothetical protein
MRKVSRVVYPWIAGLLAAACLWFAVDALRQGTEATHGYVVVMAVATLLFAATAASVQFCWRVAPLLVFLSGFGLVLYSTSVLLLGWEDVGGALIAVPLILLTAVPGILGLTLSSRAAFE